MKKLIFIILIISNQYLYSQNYKAGIRVDILTGNKYINWEVGPSLILNYDFIDFPISVQANTRFYLSEISGNEFTSSFTFTDLSIGASVNYYPIDWAIEPYVGLGIFYNFNNISQDGNESPFYNETIRGPDKIVNNFSEDITAGIKFSANSPINFTLEVTQSLNKPGKIITRDSNTFKIISEEKMNLNSLFLRVGILFKI